MDFKSKEKKEVDVIDTRESQKTDLQDNSRLKNPGGLLPEEYNTGIKGKKEEDNPDPHEVQKEIRQNLDKEKEKNAEDILIQGKEEKNEPIKIGGRKSIINETDVTREIQPAMEYVSGEKMSSRVKKELADDAQTQIRLQGMRQLVVDFTSQCGDLSRDVNADMAKYTDMDKNSVTFTEVLNSYSTAMQYLNQFLQGSVLNLDIAVTLLLRVSQAARDYYDTHRGHRSTTKGKERKDIAVRLNDRIAELFIRLREIGTPIPEGQDEVLERHPTREEKSLSETRMNELSGNYVRWVEKISKNVTDTPEEKLRQRLNILEAYEPHLTNYRRSHDPDNVPAGYRYLLREYDRLRTEESVIKWAREHDRVPANAGLEATGYKPVSSVIMDHVNAADYRNVTEQKLDKDRIDAGLTSRQLEAINQIDRWFIRNSNNGGLAGKLTGRLKNRHDYIVSALLNKTKRERLHIYYLIEKGTRKHPSALDLGMSQTYIPNFDAFRDVMLTTRFKFIRHLNGSYVLIHKLSEAMNITRLYQEELSTIGRIATESGEELPEDAGLKQAARDRKKALNKVYVKALEYQELLIRAEHSSGAEHRQVKAGIPEAADAVKAALNELLKSNEALRDDGDDNQADALKEKVPNRSANNVKGAAVHLNLMNKVTKFGGTKLAMIHKVSRDWLNVPWNLDAGRWTDITLWAGNIGAATSVVGSLLSGITNVYNLVQNGSDMTAVNYTEVISATLNSFASGALGVMKGTEAVQKAGLYAEKIVNGSNDALKEALKSSTAVQTLGYATAGVNIGIGALKMAGALRDGSHASSASRYFKNKQAPRIKGAPIDYSREARASRYEEKMLKLSEAVRGKKKTSAGLKMATGATAIVGLTIPVIGWIATTVGLGLSGMAKGLSVAQQKKLQEKMFDSYFELNSIQEKVHAQLQTNGRYVKDYKALRSELRKKVAAIAGYGSIGSACNHIAREYAIIAHSKIFDEDVPADEKKAYKNLVESFGLSVNYKKQRPTIDTIAKKMSGR